MSLNTMYPEEIHKVRSECHSYLPSLLAKKPMNIETIYNNVKETIPDLCNDAILCSCGGLERNEPEWKHQVRWALNELSDRNIVFRDEQSKNWCIKDSDKQDAFTFNISHDKFEEGHRCFEYYLYTRSPSYYDGRKVYFSEVGLKHRTLLREEIRYKVQVHSNAREALSLKNWSQWQKKNPKNIVEAVKKACKKSSNLLEHRFGDERSSENVLYKIKKNEIKGLANQLYDFFKEKTDFGNRFDSLISYFQENKLNPSWAFLSYLAFLSDENNDKYLHIRPEWIQQLFGFYDINVNISKDRSWNTYSKVLALSDALRAKLKEKGYSPLDTIEIHSYMWIVARHLKEKIPADFISKEPDFHKESSSTREEDEEFLKAEEKFAQTLDYLSDQEIEEKLSSYDKDGNLIANEDKVQKAGVKKRSRDPALSAYMKRKCKYTCQICGVPTFEGKSGHNYTETHHVIPREERGADIPKNIIVVCPTCHRKFDRGNEKTLIEVYKIIKHKHLFNDFKVLKDLRIISNKIFNEIINC